MTEEAKEKLIKSVRGVLRVVRCMQCSDICYADEDVWVNDRDDGEFFCCETCALEYLTYRMPASDMVRDFGEEVKRSEAIEYGYTGDE